LGLLAPESDVYLKCTGYIVVHSDSGVPQTQENQEIAAHITRGVINFSGNPLLLGENIKLCTPIRTADQSYFDSESCSGQSRNDPKRKYGTFNKITGKLQLTNQLEGTPTPLVEGTFKCTTVEPLVK
jgi:hypothetical protein